jgi:hypothetical protein
MIQLLSGLSVTIVFLALAFPFRKRNKAPRFVTACHFIAGVGLAGGVWGGIVDGFTGFIPQAILGLLVIALTLVFGIGLIIDLKDGKPDKQAQWIAFAIPLLLVLLPGSFGAQTQNLVQQVNTGATTVVSNVNGN